MKVKSFALVAVLLLAGAACGREPSSPIGAGAGPSPVVSPDAEPVPTEATTDPVPPETDAEPAQIVVSRPSAGDRVASPMRIEGDADVFEATVSLRLVTTQGRVLAEDFTTATCGSGCRGDYRTRLRFEVSEVTDAVLEVFESSAEDGSELHMVRVPLTLLP